ncbi:MAG: helix-turn-helix transcriptional regulator [Deltaproteobacteria bacterium]|nr:helix-turn-helix transcriptional regulator [Deltaproteobacteria bacterium]
MSDNTDKKCSSAEALLAAACKLFSEKGYEAVSTRELADCAGVNLAAIQYHYGSKAKLFVEAVRSLMKSSDCQSSQDLLTDAEGEEQAAVKLCVYVQAVLEDIVNRQGPQPCRLMFREILGGCSGDAEMYEALVSSVVEEFVRPLDNLLLDILDRLAPKMAREQKEWSAQSIFGQISFYLTHRPFYERLRGRDLADPNTLAAIARHVARFSLRGLGVEEKLINTALAAAFAGKASRKVKNAA